MNTPNRLTTLRVIMIPLFVFLLLWKSYEYSEYYAAAVFVLACITDFLDGYIARKYNLVTTFGKFMDPLADKLLVNSALICFVADSTCPMPAWVAIIIIARDTIISGYRLIAAEKNIVISASYWGKVKTATQMVMAIVLILDFQFKYIEIIENVLIYAALVLTIISLVDYLYKNRDVLRDEKNV